MHTAHTVFKNIQNIKYFLYQIKYRNITMKHRCPETRPRVSEVSEGAVRWDAVEVQATTTSEDVGIYIECRVGQRSESQPSSHPSNEASRW